MSSNRRLRRIGAAAVALAAICTAGGRLAAEPVTWSNPQGPYDWGAAANWKPDRVPNGTDQVLFDWSSFQFQTAPITLLLGGHRAAASLELDSIDTPLTIGSSEDVAAGHSLRLESGFIRLDDTQHPVVIAADLILGESGHFRGRGPLLITGAIAGSRPEVGVHFETTAHLSSASSYAGPTTVGRELWLLGEAGSVRHTSEVLVTNSARLYLANGPGANGDRIHDAARVRLRDGTLHLIGAPAVALTETVGPIELVAGVSMVRLSSDTAGSATLVASSLERAPGAVANILLMPLTTIRFTTPPVLSGSGTPAAGVIPYLFAGGPVTYDPGPDSVPGNGDDVGLRTLTAAERVPYNLAEANHNASAVASSTQSYVGKQVNSLAIAASSLQQNFVGTGTIGIGSGSLALHGGPIISGFSAIDFGRAEGVIYTAGHAVISSPITGSGGLTKAGSSGLHLKGNHSFSGDLHIAEGAFAFDESSGVGSGPGEVILSGGYLIPTNSAVTVSRPIRVANGSPTIEGGGTIAGAVRSAADTQLTLEPVRGPLVFTGAVELAGALMTRHNPIAPPATPIVFSGPTVLGSVQHQSKSTLTLAGPTTLNATLVARSPLVLSGPVSGTGGILLSPQSASATLTSTASHSFTGDFALDVRNVLVGADDALGRGRVAYTDLTIKTDGLPRTLHNASFAYSGSQGLVVGGPGSGDLTIVLTDPSGGISGPVTVLNDGEEVRTLTIDTRSAVSITKLGDGRLVLRGENRPRSFVTVDAGELSLGLVGPRGVQLQARAEGRIVYLSDNQASSWTLSGRGEIDLNDHTESLSGIAIARTTAPARESLIRTGAAGKLVVSGVVSSTAQLADTARVMGNVEFPSQVYFDVADAPVPVDFDLAANVSGSGRISTRGTGTLRLSGPVTHTGPIDVVRGTLLVDTALSASNQVTVGVDGTLGGVGIVPTLSVVGAATVSPGPDGAGPGGTLLTGALSLTNTSGLLFDLNTPGVPGGPNDRLVVDGDLVLDGILLVRPGGGFSAGEYTLFEYSGDLTDRGLIALSVDFSYIVDTSTPGRVSLKVPAVPEPAGALSLAAGIVALWRRRRPSPRPIFPEPFPAKYVVPGARCARPVASRQQSGLVWKGGHSDDHCRFPHVRLPRTFPVHHFLPPHRPVPPRPPRSSAARST